MFGRFKFANDVGYGIESVGMSKYQTSILAPVLWYYIVRIERVSNAFCPPFPRINVFFLLIHWFYTERKKSTYTYMYIMYVNQMYFTRYVACRCDFWFIDVV